VAASSAAWGWQSSKSGVTIPKSFGFEAATHYGATNQCYPECELFEPCQKKRHIVDRKKLLLIKGSDFPSSERYLSSHGSDNNSARTQVISIKIVVARLRYPRAKPVRTFRPQPSVRRVILHSIHCAPSSDRPKMSLPFLRHRRMRTPMWLQTRSHSYGLCSYRYSSGPIGMSR